MHIKEVAKKLNITARAIRFYEEKGLISPHKDAQNQYRIFHEKDIWRLQTIISLRESGMPLEDIGTALMNIEGDDYEELLHYLELQRSVMFAKWLEIQSAIELTDNMITIVRKKDKLPLEDIFELANSYKRLRDQRSIWQDKWNFDHQAPGHDEQVRVEEKYRDYEAALLLTAQWIAPIAGEHGLDIGTGTGNLAQKLMQYGAHMSGVDQSKEMLRLCREKLPHMETRLGNFLALPYLKEQFDFVASSFAFHHLSVPQQEMAIDEMQRVLKPRGRICITDIMYPESGDRQNEEADIVLERLIHMLEKRHYVTKWQAVNDRVYTVYAIPIR